MPPGPLLRRLELTFRTFGLRSPPFAGGHRLAASFLDGICDEHDIRLISLDRPSSGGSTPVPLSHRFAWTHEALLALFGKLSITRFSILSHSNGDLYTLYTLLHLPPELTVDSWVLSSPYVPPWLSGSIPLSIARYIPAGATGSLGTLLSGVMKAESWSTGTASDLLAFSGGLSAGLTSVSAGTGWGKGGGVAPPTAGEAKEEESELERGDSQERKFIQFALRQADKEEHCRVYGQSCAGGAPRLRAALTTPRLSRRSVLPARDVPDWHELGAGGGV